MVLLLEPSRWLAGERRTRGARLGGQRLAREKCGAPCGLQLSLQLHLGELTWLGAPPPHPHVCTSGQNVLDRGMQVSPGENFARGG